MQSESLAALASNATEGAVQINPDFFYYEPSLTDARNVFERFGVHWNPLIEADAINALRGAKFEYFTDCHEFAAQARAEMGIDYEMPAGGMWSLSDITEQYGAILARRKMEVERYGVSVTSFLENQWACPKEQAAFYQTDTWRRCSAAQRYLGKYKCTRCAAHGSGLHVHHIMPIQTGYGTNFDTNFAEWKLTLLCEDCHREYHRRAVRTYGSHEYELRTDADAKADKAENRKAWSIVHQLGQCQYCNNAKVQP